MSELQSRIRRFRDLHEQHPGARFFAPLADLLRQEGDHDEALRLLQAGLAAHDGYLAGLVIQGRTLQEVGRHAEAYETWQHVRRIDPDNLLALEFLADWSLDCQDWERAEPLLEHLCGLLSEDSPWCGQLARARAERERQRERLLAEQKAALEAQRQAEDEDRQAAARSLVGAGSSFDTMTLVDIYLAQGYREQALSVLQRMLPGAGEDRQEILDRIRLLESVHDKDEAEACATPAGGGMAEAVGAEFGGDAGRRLAPRERLAREEERARRRDQERRQFEEWLARIRLDGEEKG